jgi:hypothetical protein
MKIRPVEAELLDADRWKDRQTDRQRVMTKLIVAIRTFASIIHLNNNNNNNYYYIIYNIIF